MPPYTYIEILEFGTSACVKRIDVTGKPRRSQEVAEAGVVRNLNLEKYYTNIKLYTKPQPII